MQAPVSCKDAPRLQQHKAEAARKRQTVRTEPIGLQLQAARVANIIRIPHMATGIPFASDALDAARSPAVFV